MMILTHMEEAVKSLDEALASARANKLENEPFYIQLARPLVDYTSHRPDGGLWRNGPKEHEAFKERLFRS